MCMPFSPLLYSNFSRNYQPDYQYQNQEPVSGNYYPIDSRILLSDSATSLAVLTDRSHGGSSMNDGQVEIMVLLLLDSL